MAPQSTELVPSIEAQPSQQKDVVHALAALIVPDHPKDAAVERKLDQQQEAVLYQGGVWGTAASASVVTGLAQASPEALRRRDEQMNQEVKLGFTEKKKRSGSSIVDDVWFQRLIAVIGEQAATDIKTKIESFAKDAGSGLQVNAGALQQLSKDLTQALGADVITKLGVKPDAVENALFEQLKKNDALIKQLQEADTDPYEIIERLNLEAMNFTTAELDRNAIRASVLKVRTGTAFASMPSKAAERPAPAIIDERVDPLASLKADIATFVAHPQTRALSAEKRGSHFEQQLEKLEQQRGLSSEQIESLRAEFKRLDALAHGVALTALVAKSVEVSEAAKAEASRAQAQAKVEADAVREAERRKALDQVVGKRDEQVVSKVSGPGHKDHPSRGEDELPTRKTEVIREQASTVAQEKNRLPEHFGSVDRTSYETRNAEINATLLRLVKTSAGQAYDQQQTPEQIRSAMAELFKVAGPATSQHEVQEILNRFVSLRDTERRALMMQEIVGAGRDMASGEQPPSTSAVQQRLQAIRSRYADVDGVELGEVKRLFSTAFDKEHAAKLSKLSWGQRLYRGTTQLLSDAIEWSGDAIQWTKGAAVAAGSTLVNTGIGIAKLSKDLLQFGATVVMSGAEVAGKFVYKVVTDPAGALSDLSHAASTVAGFVKSSALWIVNTGLQLAKWGLSAGTYLLQKGVEFNVALLTGDFSKAWGMVQGTVSAAWGFADSMASSLGLKEMFWGVVALGRAGPQLAYDLTRAAFGQGTVQDAFVNFKGNLGQAASGVVGCVRCIGELTGVTDLGLAVYHSANALAAYGRGDQAAVTSHLLNASMHGAFALMSAGSIAATVATGGAAIGAVAGVAMLRTTAKEAGKIVLKTAAKEFLQAGAKEIGEQALTRMGKEALQILTKETGAAVQLTGKEALQALLQVEGRHIADQGCERLVKEIAEHGASKALAPEAVRTILAEESEKRVAALLCKLKLPDVVDDLTFKMLKDVSEGKAKHVAKEFSERFGVTEGEARQMVNQMRSALRSKRSDEAMKQVLEDGITKEVTQVLRKEMEASFKEQFRKGLTDPTHASWSKQLTQSVEAEAKRLGKTTSELADDLVKKGWQGVEEGIERATRAAVREGLERAFKRFREGHRYRGSFGMGSAVGRQPIKEATAEGGSNHADESSKAGSQPAEVESGHRIQTRQRIDTLADGSKIVIVEALNLTKSTGEEWVKIGEGQLQKASRDSLTLAA